MTDCDHAWALDIHQGREQVRCMLCGVLAHASPTQLEDWRACPRKWKYRRLRRSFPVPENQWAAFGSRAHVIREHWLRSGTWTEAIATSKEGQCVAAGIEHWPRPGQALGVEIELDKIDLLNDGIPWTFKIDDVAPPSHSYDLGDLKTIGRIQYRKTEADLIEDAQRVVYSVWGGPVLGLDTIRSSWSYCQRSPPTSIPVTVESKVEHDRQRLRVINNEARAMIMANLRPLDEQDRNRATCYKYKGSPCAYAEHCLGGLDQISVDIDAITPYTPDQGLAPMTAPVLTLADALAQQAATAPPLPPMPGAAPALPPVPVAPPRVVLTPELEAWVASCVAQGHSEATVRAQAEAAMAPAPAAPPSPAPAVALPHVVAPVVQQPAIETTIAASPQTVAEVLATAPPTRGRGRPPKSSTDATSPGGHLHMVAATLSANLPSVTTPAAAVAAYVEILALLGGE